jgi:hypothetical protein
MSDPTGTVSQAAELADPDRQISNYPHDLAHKYHTEANRRFIMVNCLSPLLRFASS